MQRFGNKLFTLAALVALLLFGGCESELDKYYKIPDWLKGNAYQLLESKGNYKLFLEAVERAGYKDVISGKGIITIMAPSDDAFKIYLESKGYATIADIPESDLKKLVGFHLVYYSFDKAKFANYRPEGVSDTKVYPDAGLYYKFRTKSSSALDRYIDHTTAPGTEQVSLLVYHKERFLPILSSFLFETKQIDAARNYEYFYPGTTWNGQDGGFCVSNANVEEYALVTDNGYVYTINKVLDPLETIHKELEIIPEFSLFRQLYDKFQDFQLTGTAVDPSGNKENMYLYYHTDLPKIASEWTYNGEGSLPDYADLATLSKKAYNLFAPTNASLLSFFNQFWKDYYPSIVDVPLLPVKYLLDNHVYEGDIVFPEEIEKGKITTKFGTPIDFNTSDVFAKKLCVNGTFYGLNNLMVPSMFTSVTGPLFQDPKYQIFLQMMDATSMMLPLTSNDLQFNMFVSSDWVIEQNTTIEGNAILYQNLNPNKFKMQTVMIESDQGYSAMSVSAMTTFVKNHICSRLMTTVGNKKIYKNMNSFQYLLVEDDKKVYSSHIFNNYNENPAVIEATKDAYNGKTYKVDSENSIALIPDYSLFKEQVTKNPIPGTEGFKTLVESAQLHTQSPPFTFLQGERFIVFVPTNEAISKGTGSIPTEPAADVAKYLQYYFVNVSQSSLNDYPFAGAGIQGQLTTFRQKEDGSRAKITLIDTGSGLQVKDEAGNVVNVVGVFPRIYNDGAAYLIDGLLQLQ